MSAQIQTQTQLSKQSAILQTSIKRLPVALSGKGVWITVQDPETGEERLMLDGNSGAAVSSVGHGDDEIKAKMIEAVDKVVYNFPLMTSNQPSEELAQFIIDNSPEGAFETATFTGSGSESNENALKLVRKYHIENGDLKRVKFISRKQSYHGFTIGALSISDNLRKFEFSDILMPEEVTPKTSQCYPYRHMKDGETLEQYKDRLLQDLEDVFIKEGPDTIAAFICETVTGSTFGCSLPIPGYLDGCRDICHKYGALFYLDEVMCGMGRMGSLHAWEQFMEGPGPDIQTNGKTLGAGYVTIASILVSPRVMKVFKDKKSLISGAQTYHSHTFNCQVALEVQKKVKRDNMIANIKEQGAYFGMTLREKLANSKTAGDIRGAGGFWAIEWVKDRKTKEPFPKEFGYGAKFTKKLYDNGVFNLGGTGTIDGVIGEHALFSPAFSITREEIDELISRIVKTVEELESEVFA
ncbi:CYFA0S18e01640g1_1 [Cyberlindnera fabianii]|uniref:CYFA0S18e01640g1_1 n=1 Tax=Cyberlindnera fabianii TaxID=36022 RepID=A0A061B7R5_CYBFA|nr:CYFA0S18e01640g1_1 [Cyberlindnera fabianii]